jgi:hypothetical protein
MALVEGRGLRQRYLDTIRLKATKKFNRGGGGALGSRQAGNGCRDTATWAVY